MHNASPILGPLLSLALLTSACAQPRQLERPTPKPQVKQQPQQRTVRELTQLTQDPKISAQERLETHSILAAHHQQRGVKRQASQHIDQALKLWSQLESDPSIKGEARTSACHAAARAMFARAEQAHWEFERIKLKLKEQELKAKLEQKTQLVKSAQTHYNATFNLGQQCSSAVWKLAAKVRNGDVLATFAIELDEVKVPYKVEQEDLDKFKQTIRAISGPLLKSAQEHYEIAQMISPKDPVANIWSKLAQSKLEDIKRYQCEHEHEGCATK